MGDTGVRVTGRLVFGAVVLVLGVLFTLDNLGLLDSGDIIQWWPLAVLLYGLMRLTGIGAQQKVVRGVIFSLIGAWLLLDNLGFVDIEVSDLWPLLMIAFGVMLVTGAMRFSAPGGKLFGGAAGSSDDSSTISAFALWSGTDRKVVSQSFRGGDVTAVMGGHEIDLRSAEAENGRCEIDLFVWWGGVDLRVPENWKVSVESLVLMGGVEDHTKAPSGEIRGHLVLKGLVVMGGVEVKN